MRPLPPLAVRMGITTRRIKNHHSSAPAYLADYCTSNFLVLGRSALRSAAHGDIVVPSHRTD